MLLLRTISIKHFSFTGWWTHYIHLGVREHDVLQKGFFGFVLHQVALHFEPGIKYTYILLEVNSEMQID